MSAWTSAQKFSSPRTSGSWLSVQFSRLRSLSIACISSSSSGTGPLSAIGWEPWRMCGSGKRCVRGIFNICFCFGWWLYLYGSIGGIHCQVATGVTPSNLHQTTQTVHARYGSLCWSFDLSRLFGSCPLFTAGMLWFFRHNDPED